AQQLGPDVIGEVPQVAGDDHINMIVHPAVTSIAERITSQGTGGTTVAEYPVITTREAEILIPDQLSEIFRRDRDVRASRQIRG
ncbi:MAG: hypothetical protein AAB425_07025, partial [Bdellovibrionota bacterium]